MPGRRNTARSRRWATGLGVAVVVGAFAGSCSSTSPTTTATDSTETTAVPETTTTLEPAVEEGKQLFVYSPTEGDCIDLRAKGLVGAFTTKEAPGADATPRTSSQLILRLDCGLPHQYEVIAVVGAGLPPADATDADEDPALIIAAKQKCPQAFPDYIGTPYQSSQLELGWVLPATAQRERGNQEIGCLAFDPTGKLVGSVRSSGR